MMSKNKTKKKLIRKRLRTWAALAVAVCMIGTGITACKGSSEAAAVSPVSQDTAADERQIPETVENEAAQTPPAEEEEESSVTPPPAESTAQPASFPASTPPELVPESTPESSAAPEPEEPSSAPETSETEQSKTVYITRTGKRYHYDNHCNGGTYFESTLEEALERNLTPCKKCVG